MEERTVAVVGVGRMGANIARRLREVGWNIAAVHDTDVATRQAVAEELDARAAASPEDAAEGAGIIVTAVSDERAMRDIYRDSAGGLLASAPGKLFINTATVSPSTHSEIDRRARDHGSRSLEACLLGTVPHARAGSLYILAAGGNEAYRAAEPLLTDISARLRYVGAPGEAGKVKAIVNMVMNINVAGLAEGLGVGEALGIPADLLLDALQHSAAASRALETHAKAMLSGQYGRFLTADHAAKDAAIALDLAQGAGVDTPLARAVKGQYERMGAEGLGQEDLAGVAQLTFPGRRPTGGSGA